VQIFPFTSRQTTDKTGEHNMGNLNLLEQRAIISRELLITVMKELGTPVKLARLVKELVEYGQCDEELQGAFSELLEGGTVIFLSLLSF